MEFDWDGARGRDAMDPGDCGTEGATTSALCWPAMDYDRGQVCELGVAAYCWTPDGALWEFDGGEFFVTRRGERGRLAADELAAPLIGWSHQADCQCPACRVNRL